MFTGRHPEILLRRKKVKRKNRKMAPAVLKSSAIYEPRKTILP